ncbi:DUF4440 domain-containing protein [Dyadobacter arcticus]|uniref:Tetratricopeptide (TPR) repeat protein n=1 Tax=Dyadobacter arcticus TaxID=1078754 RepID=A0ABX0ULL5_9BACT|nr:DUF4440 domain-containing protein [Dyadobacter arcticus]NIJ53802.1 tetratricopeptide (TPR) repeat protein [Dyadobacter arcticus]
MKHICYSTFLLLIFAVKLVQAQSEEEKLKSIVRLESESYMKKDSVTWKSLYKQDANTVRFYGGNGFYNHNVGWNNFGPTLLGWMKENPKPSSYTAIDMKNYNIQVSGNLATVSYTQRFSAPGIDSLRPSGTLEYRTLVKEGQKWKIVAVMSFDTLSFSSTRQSLVESQFNTTGYNFLNEKKVKEAIEIFKLNVTLYPDSWNAYDSLGEGYAAAGEKTLAIQNYEKSIQLNPDNSAGKEILQKLKAN